MCPALATCEQGGEAIRLFFLGRPGGYHHILQQGFSTKEQEILIPLSYLDTECVVTRKVSNGFLLSGWFGEELLLAVF